METPLTAGMTPDNELFIQQQLTSGTFQDRGDVLNAAVELLKQRQRLIERLTEADRQLQCGEYTDYDEEGLRRFFEELKEEAQAIIDASQARGQDLREIAQYLAKESPASVHRIIDALYDAFRFLSERPHAGTVRDDLRSELRVFSPKRPAHNYVVFFRPTNYGIQVLAVLHGARDYEGMFSRGER